MQQRKRLTYLVPALLVLVLLLGFGGAAMNRQMHRSQVNRALFHAVTQRDVTAVDALLAQGADANARFDFLMMQDLPLRFRLSIQWQRFCGTQIRGESPALCLAVAFGSERMVRALLAHGADPNVQGGYGNTALHTAVRGQNKGMVQALIEAGADVSRRNDGGKTPLQIAKQHSAVKVAALLRKAGARD